MDCRGQSGELILTDIKVQVAAAVRNRDIRDRCGGRRLRRPKGRARIRDIKGVLDDDPRNGYRE